MPDKLSFRKTFQALEQAISITQKRHSHIVSNISNLDTPDYRSKDIDFKTALNRAIDSDHSVHAVRTNPGHIDLGRDGSYGIEPFEDHGEWNGYNWVNIDREITKLTENNLMFRTTIETLLRKMALLKEVIKEGGR